MATRMAFRSMVRELLTDETAWPDGTLNAWLNDALRDYSNFFPRFVEATINCTAATRFYALTSYTGIKAVVGVEYPAGRTPPRYLAERPEPGSFVGNPVYALRGDPPVMLVIGESPATGETIGLDYHALHTIPTADSDVLTAPDQHLEALKLFCIWMAIRELEMNEAQDPDKSTLLLNMLGMNAFRAERSYRAKIQEYMEMAGGGRYSGPWIMDRYDRVY